MTWRRAAGVSALVVGVLACSTATPADTVAQAICGSIGGRHVDVSGCSDPLSELQGVLAPPPPGAPPPPPVAAPPPLPPNVQVCGSVGRRVTVSGCI